MNKTKKKELDDERPIQPLTTRVLPVSGAGRWNNRRSSFGFVRLDFIDFHISLFLISSMLFNLVSAVRAGGFHPHHRQ